MATYVTLTVPVADIIGADYQTARTSAYIEANTPNSVIVVDGDEVRVGGRRENVSSDGTVVFANLVATDTADNPATFEYRITLVYTPKGAKTQQSLRTSTFPLTADGNLAAIDEAWDDVTAPPSWRSTFRDEMEALVAEAEAARDAAVDVSGIDTSDGVMAAVAADTGSDFYAVQTATYAALGSVAAETQAGATAANKITNAAAAAAYGQPVVVSRSLASSPNPIPPLSDLAVVSGRMIVDYRRQVGTVSNRWQRGSMQLSEVFGADEGAVGDYAADNGSIIAVDAILAAGTGGNGSGGTVARGENVAGYFGVHRTGGTRSAWALNTVTTTDVDPGATFQTIGLEVDLNNNSGVDAASDTVVDGVVVLTGGTDDPRHGLDIGSANATRWSKGVVVSGVKDTAVEIAAGATKGLVCQPPAEFADDTYFGGGIRMGGATAKLHAAIEDGTWQLDSIVGGVGQRTILDLLSNGTMTVYNQLGADPAIKAGSSAANAHLNLFPKGTGTINMIGPVRLGSYTTAGRPSAATAGTGATVYDTTLSKPIYSDGAVWRDAMGTAV